MPLGQYKDFADCMKRAPKGVKSRKKYCGKIFWKVHGKKEGKKHLKKKMEEFREALKKLKEMDK